jgi:hypothetical protein
MSEYIKPGYTRVSDFCSRYEDFGSVEPGYLAYRAEVGTHVHTAIREYLCGMTTDLTSEEQLYFDSWLTWYNLMGSPIITNEEARMYCDKWMLTGAIDGIIHIQGCMPMILDWKTSSSEDADIWPLKGAFYLYLAKLNNICKELDDRVYYLKLDKKGGAAKVCEYEITPYLKGMVTATMMTYRFEEKVKVNKKNWRNK